MNEADLLSRDHRFEEPPMLTQGLMLFLMLQTPGTPPPEAKGATSEEYLTLDEIIAEDENSGTTPFDEMILKYANKAPEILGPQPPENKDDYAVAIANIMTMPPEKLFAFAQYQGQVPIENLGKDIKLGASEARMATLNLVADLETVAKYYAQELAAKNIVPMVNQLKANSIYFAWRPEDGFMRTMTLVEIGRQTVVFAAVTDARKVYESFLGLDGRRSSKPWDDWQEPEHEGTPIVFQQSEGATVQTTRKITVKGDSLDEVMRYYNRELALSGWKMTQGGSRQDESLSATFEKGSRRCSVTITPGAQEGVFESLSLCQEYQ